MDAIFLMFGKDPYASCKQPTRADVLYTHNCTQSLELYFEYNCKPSLTTDTGEVNKRSLAGIGC